jgi:hypothetical protein
LFPKRGFLGFIQKRNESSLQTEVVKNSRFGTEEELPVKCDSGGFYNKAGKAVVLNKRMGVGLKNRTWLKRLIFHELSHGFGVGSNHWVTSNALENYIRFSTSSNSQQEYVLRTSFFGAKSNYPTELIHKAIDFSFDKKLLASEWEKFLVADKEAIARKIKRVDFEHSWPILGMKLLTFERVGVELAHLALEVEKKHGVIGSGLILIREVSLGVPIEKAISKLQKGQYDNQARKYLSENPSIRRAIQLT